MKKMLIKKLKSLRPFRRSNSKVSTVVSSSMNSSDREITAMKGGELEIKWELRPGGMLVQKREDELCTGHEALIRLKVSTGLTFHDISIEATTTFGELKAKLTKVTSLEVKEQRLLYKGKERDDNEHLHMVGVSDKDKILLLQDPAIREMKLKAIPCRNTFPAAASLRSSIMTVVSFNHPYRSSPQTLITIGIERQH